MGKTKAWDEEDRVRGSVMRTTSALNIGMPFLLIVSRDVQLHSFYNSKLY